MSKEKNIIRCTCCNCYELVRATVKKSSKKVAVCVECDCVYELDENLNPITDITDIAAFRELQKCFKTWDELTDIVPYDVEMEEEA